MSTEVTYERCDGFLRVTCSGPFPTTTYREILADIRKEVAQSGDTCVLIDALNLSGPDSDMERFGVGVAVAELFGYRIKVAVLYPPAFINKFAENAAINRGGSMLVVSDEAIALQWLGGNAARSSTPEQG